VTERWRDVAHIGHAELLTPTPEASLEYFTTLLGLIVVAEQGGSWYLRGYGDYEPYSLKLTASPSPGLGHLAVRAWSPEALARRVAWLKDAGVPGGWVDPEAGKGPAYEFTDPDGHRIRVYYETSKYVPAAGDRPAMKSNHQRYRGVGANVRRLEHVNLMASDVRACREFWADGLGLRTFEIIRRDDGSEDGAWLSSTVQGHEVIYVRDYLAGSGRLHHLAFWVDSREDVLRAADLMNDAGVPIEAGPSRHIPIQGLQPLAGPPPRYASFSSLRISLFVEFWQQVSCQITMIMVGGAAPGGRAALPTRQTRPWDGGRRVRRQTTPPKERRRSRADVTTRP
jgi:catechol 2,3-dioxygenase